MATIGRNQPCPCGSGKKYKKCCLNKEESSPIATTSERNNLDSAPSAGAPMPPYVLAKEFECSEQFAAMQRFEPEKARQFWIPSRVAALDTDAILQRLARLGIVTDIEDFECFSETFTSAWSVSNVWRAKFHEVGLPRHEHDFLGLAACELWKRYCPNTPSMEMLDDWMQQGYRLMMRGDAVRACNLWNEVWDVILPRLKPAMRTCEQASPIFEGTQCLFNWIQDFCLELSNAALGAPRYATVGVRLCEDVLSQFVDESQLFLRNFRTDLGHFHFLAGSPEDGERVLLEVIRDHPDTAVGYARLAEMLACGVRPGDEPINPQRAQEILKEALARPVEDATQYDLESRLQEICDVAAKL